MQLSSTFLHVGIIIIIIIIIITTTTTITDGKIQNLQILFIH